MKASKISSILVNGSPATGIDVSDRGLSYGHGVFETIRIANQQPLLWDLHIARLIRGCSQLKINLLEGIASVLEQEVLQLIKQSSQINSIIKVTITAGQGRGYAITECQEPQRIVALYPLVEYSQDIYEQGIEIRTCDYRLPKNKYLAGIKHLNRLDQVIARAEWTDKKFFEGILLDEQGHVVEGVMSNLFASVEGKLITPDLSYAGVQGTMRDYLLAIAKDLAIETEEVVLTEQAFHRADELFVCNSVMGILPVNTWAESRFKTGSVTRALQTRVKKLFQGAGR